MSADKGDRGPFEASGDDERSPTAAASGENEAFIDEPPGRPARLYEYRNAEGRGVFVMRRRVVDGQEAVDYRAHPRDGKDGPLSWVDDIPMERDRPLYRLPELLNADPNRRVMVVEDERLANVVARASEKASPVAWAGGANAWKKTDWSPVYGRKLLLVANGDEAGHERMEALAAFLHPHCPDITLVLPPPAKGGPGIADEFGAGRDDNAWPKAHWQAYRPDAAGDGSPDPSPPHSPEGGNGDEWSSLMAEATDRPGVFFTDETLGRLAARKRERPDLWVNLRARIKRECKGVSVHELDKAMDRLTGGGASLQGQPIEWQDPEPWPEPVDGAALLDEVAAIIRRYVQMPEGGAEAVVAWALYAWCFKAFGVCPNMMMTAPERESGKTRVTELLSWMVPRPKPVSDASAAAIIRGIERDRPTLLFDEAQHFLRRRPEDPIRGILLAGFTRRFATVERCEGEANEVRAFSTFTPKAMNGRKLAAVDDMLTSRSVVIPMTRARCRMPDLSVIHDPVGDDIRSMCARWRNDNKDALTRATPDVGGLFGRIADVWRPLFAVADAAGGGWPGLVRNAALSLATLTATVADGDSLGVQLLGDIRQVFEARGNPDQLPAAELDQTLVDMPERPWASASNGKPMTPQKRGQMLKHYGIRTTKVRDGGKPVNAYLRSELEPAWEAWLSPCAPASEPEHRNSR